MPFESLREMPTPSEKGKEGKEEVEKERKGKKPLPPKPGEIKEEIPKKEPKERLSPDTEELLKDVYYKEKEEGKGKGLVYDSLSEDELRAARKLIGKDLAYIWEDPAGKEKYLRLSDSGRKSAARYLGKSI